MKHPEKETQSLIERALPMIYYINEAPVNPTNIQELRAQAITILAQAIYNKYNLTKEQSRAVASKSLQECTRTDNSINIQSLEPAIINYSEYSLDLLNAKQVRRKQS